MFVAFVCSNSNSFKHLNREILKRKNSDIIVTMREGFCMHGISLIFIQEHRLFSIYKNAVGILDQERRNSCTTIHITFTPCMLKCLEFSFSVYTSCHFSLPSSPRILTLCTLFRFMKCKFNNNRQMAWLLNVSTNMH